MDKLAVAGMKSVLFKYHTTYAATYKSTYNTVKLGKFVKEVIAYSSMLYKGLGYFHIEDVNETLFHLYLIAHILRW